MTEHELVEAVVWDPRLHPRGRIGQFRRVLFHMLSGGTVKLPHGVEVKKRGGARDTRYQVGDTVTLDPGRAADLALRKFDQRDLVMPSPPTGREPSLGESLDLPKSGKLAGPARKAVALIDGLLRVPEMRGPLKIRATSGKNARGGYVRKAEEGFEDRTPTWQGPTVRMSGFGPGQSKRPAKPAKEIVPGDVIVRGPTYEWLVTDVETQEREIGFGRDPITEIVITFDRGGAEKPMGSLEVKPRLDTSRYKPDELVGIHWEPDPEEMTPMPPLYPSEIRASVAPTDAAEPFDQVATLVHELGHHIDNEAFRRYHLGRGYASQHAAMATVSEEKMAEGIERLGENSRTRSMVPLFEQYAAEDSAIQKWWTAVQASSEVEELRSASVMEHGTHKYLLSPEELFARSFEQWVATRSGDSEMRQWLDSWQNMPEKYMKEVEGWQGTVRSYETARPKHMLKRYWSEESFKPIAEALDESFAELGWLRDRGSRRERDADPYAGRGVGERPGAGDRARPAPAPFPVPAGVGVAAELAPGPSSQSVLTSRSEVSVGPKRKVSYEQSKALERGQQIARSNQRRRAEERRRAEKAQAERGAAQTQEQERERALRNGFEIGDRVTGRDYFFGKRHTGVIVEQEGYPLTDGVTVLAEDGEKHLMIANSLEAAPSPEPMASPATATWRRLGERSGDPEIDAAIAAYRARGEIADEDGPVRLDAMKHPLEAEGFCSIVGKDFAAFARERGLNAYDSGEDVRAPGYDRLTNPLFGTKHDAEAFGYTDASRKSDYDEHSATVIEKDGRTVVVDWAAAQYGYDEFPFVQETQPEPMASPATSILTKRQREVLDLLPPPEGRSYEQFGFKAGLDAHEVADQIEGLNSTGAQRVLYALVDKGLIKFDDMGYHVPERPTAIRTEGPQPVFPMLAHEVVPTDWQVEHGYAEIVPNVGFRAKPYHPGPGGRTEKDARRMLHHYLTGEPEVPKGKGAKAILVEEQREAATRWRRKMVERGWTFAPERPSPMASPPTDRPLSSWDTGTWYHVTTPNRARLIREQGLQPRSLHGGERTFGTVGLDDQVVYLWPSRAKAEEWQQYLGYRGGDFGETEVLKVSYVEPSRLGPDHEAFSELVLRPFLFEREAGRPLKFMRLPSGESEADYEALLDSAGYYKDAVGGPERETLRQWLENRPDMAYRDAEHPEGAFWRALTPSAVAPEWAPPERDPWRPTIRLLAEMPKPMRMDLAREFAERGRSAQYYGVISRDAIDADVPEPMASPATEPELPVYRLPQTFYYDHISRDLPEEGVSRITHKTKQHVYVAMDDAALKDLRSDAEHYTDEGIAREMGLRGLAASARATLKALDKGPLDKPPKPTPPEPEESPLRKHVRIMGVDIYEVQGLQTSTRVFAALQHNKPLPLGALTVDQKQGTVELVTVQKEVRRLGIASQLLTAAREATGLPLDVDTGERSEAGAAFGEARGVRAGERGQDLSEREAEAMGARLMLGLWSASGWQPLNATARAKYKKWEEEQERQPPEPMASPATATRSWHLTDDPKFKLDPERVGYINSTIGGDMDEPGIFVTQNPEFWLNRHDYVRPFVAEIEHPVEPLQSGYYESQDAYLPASAFQDTKVLRVIPLDEYARETYHEPGWIETHFGDVPSEFEPPRVPGQIGSYYKLPDDYRYTGPDVREMPPREIERHRARVKQYIQEARPHMLRRYDDNGDPVEFGDPRWEALEPEPMASPPTPKPSDVQLPVTGQPFQARLYHGTLQRNVEAIVGAGLRPAPDTEDIWLTDDRANAEGYAEGRESGSGAVVAATVTLANPFVIDRTGPGGRTRDLWEMLPPGIEHGDYRWASLLFEQGYDGIVYREADGSTDVEVRDAAKVEAPEPMASPTAGPANPRTMFHVAPREARDAIRQDGISHAEASQPTLYEPGNYLWESLPDALQYMRFWSGRDLDLYVVDARGADLRPDPLHVNYAWVTGDPISSDKLRHVDPSEYAAMASPETPKRSARSQGRTRAQDIASFESLLRDPDLSREDRVRYSIRLAELHGDEEKAAKLRKLLPPEPMASPSTERLSLAAWSGVAEDAMERAGQGGRTWVTPKGRNDEPDVQKAQQAMTEFASQVYLENGGSRGVMEQGGKLLPSPDWVQPVRVVASTWMNVEYPNARGTANSATNTISVQHKTNDLTILHEVAHLLTKTDENEEGHTPEFARTVRDLYAKYISPEAAETYWGLVGMRVEPPELDKWEQAVVEFLRRQPASEITRWSDIKQAVDPTRTEMHGPAFEALHRLRERGIVRLRHHRWELVPEQPPPIHVLDDSSEPLGEEYIYRPGAETEPMAPKLREAYREREHLRDRLGRWRDMPSIPKVARGIVRNITTNEVGSHYEDEELAPLLAAALRGIKWADEVQFVIFNTDKKEPEGWGQVIGNEKIIRLGLPAKDAFPLTSTGYHGHFKGPKGEAFPRIRLDDWREAVLYVVAHESYHVDSHLLDREQEESVEEWEAEKRGIERLEQFRALLQEAELA